MVCFRWHGWRQCPAYVWSYVLSEWRCQKVNWCQYSSSGFPSRLQGIPWVEHWTLQMPSENSSFQVVYQHCYNALHLATAGAGANTVPQTHLQTRPALWSQLHTCQVSRMCLGPNYTPVRCHFCVLVSITHLLGVMSVSGSQLHTCQVSLLCLGFNYTPVRCHVCVLVPITHLSGVTSVSWSQLQLLRHTVI